MQNNIKKLYTCQCHSEAVTIEVNHEDQEVYVTGWQMSPGVGTMSLKERLRWAWHIITRGFPFNDHIILSFDTARQISTDLYHQLKRRHK